MRACDCERPTPTDPRGMRPTSPGITWDTNGISGSTGAYAWRVRCFLPENPAPLGVFSRCASDGREAPQHKQHHRRMDDHTNTFEAPWLAAGVNYQRKFQSARVADAGESTVKSVGGAADGVLCTELLCWPYMRGEACTCDGQLAHILQGACGRNINLGFGRHRAKSCGFARCNATSHPSADECHSAVAAWWRETRGAEAEFGKQPPPAPANTAARGERSTVSAREEGAGKRCTLPASKLREHLARHEGESKHLDAFLQDPMLEEMLRDERLRALLAMRSRVKEITEAWSVCEQVHAATVLAPCPCNRALHSATRKGPRGAGRGPCATPNPCPDPSPDPDQVRALLDAETVAAGGAGVVVLDFCSGKGLGKLVSKQ